MFLVGGLWVFYKCFMHPAGVYYVNMKLNVFQLTRENLIGRPFQSGSHNNNGRYYYIVT